jgi:hypothetical protein
MSDAHKCSKCYWSQLAKNGIHIGCYAGGKWRKWIRIKDLNTPRECRDFKGLTEG